MQSIVVAFYFLRRHYPHQVLRVETNTVSSQPGSTQLPKSILLIVFGFVNLFFYFKASCEVLRENRILVEAEPFTERGLL